MQYQKVQQQMLNLDIGFFPGSLPQVHSFINQHIGQISSDNPSYHIAAAAAIICECTKLPTVGGSKEKVSSGIKIQNIMKKLSHLSKDVFLDTLNFQVQKCLTSQHHLKQKIPKIRLSYRSFKKYTNIFNKLSIIGNVPQNIKHDLQSFFWIIYLLIRIKEKMIEDLEESTAILIFMVEKIFSQFISKIQISKIHQIILSAQNFRFIPQIETSKTYYQSLVFQQIKTVFEKRSSHFENCFQHLFNDQILLSRLVDDLSQQYDHEYSKLPQSKYIDEITFLGLSKNLTPQPFPKKISSVEGIITERINFEIDQSDKFKTEKKINYRSSQIGEKITPKNLLSDFKKLQNLQSPDEEKQKAKSIFESKKSSMTPLSLGIAKSSWVRESIKMVGEKEQEYLKNILEDKEFRREDLRSKIEKCISQLLPHCLKKQICLNEIYKLGLYLIYQLSVEIKKQSSEIVLTNYVEEIFCLASCLYNYAVRSFSLDFQNYCSIFQIDLIKGFEVIYFTGSKLKIHNIIRSYLYQLQKLILIKQLWQSPLGYSILSEGKLKQSFHLEKRLHRHIEERVKQICSKVGVEANIQEKITTLIINILSQKYQLLQGNKLDQIIVCSITACLGINESKHNTAISQIFHHYNQTTNSFHSLQDGLNFREGKMNLIEFYNSIFRCELEDMMINSINQVSFICTPIREQQLQKIRGKSTLPPISKLSTSFGRSMISSGNNYQKGLKTNISKLKRNEEMVIDEREEMESPRFGPQLKRTMTFGKE